MRCGLLLTNAGRQSESPTVPARLIGEHNQAIGRKAEHFKVASTPDLVLCEEDDVDEE